DALQPIPECAIADLVVILQEIDKGGRFKRAAGLATQLTAPERGDFALIDEARRQGASDVAPRRALIVPVVTMVLMGQEDMKGVVEIVVPLRAILAGWRILRGIEHACAIVTVLEHKMDMASGFDRKLSDRRTEI